VDTIVRADVNFTAEGLAVIALLTGSLVTAVLGLHRLLIAAKDERIKDAESQRDIYLGMLREAIAIVESMAQTRARESGLKVPDPLAPVIPEHSSPASARQRQTAEMATLRARLVAASLLLGLPPRGDGDQAPPPKLSAFPPDDAGGRPNG